MGAALVSNPLCLHSSAAVLSRPWTLPYLYNLALALRLKQYVHEHRAALASHVQAKPQGSVKGVDDCFLQGWAIMRTARV